MLNFELTPEQKALVEETRRFTRERIIPVAAEADRTHEFPMDVFKEAWELGFVGPNIPEEYGGAGMGEVDHVLLTEELAFGCTGIQTSITANVLAATPILVAGNEEQKKKYLGMLTSEPVLCSVLRSPSRRRGATRPGFKTRVHKGRQRLCHQRTQKCYITNAAWARWYVVFATVDPALRHGGIMAFIVDRDAPGVSVGKTEDKLGQRASNTAQVVNLRRREAFSSEGQPARRGGPRVQAGHADLRPRRAPTSARAPAA